MPGTTTVTAKMLHTKFGRNFQQGIKHFNHTTRDSRQVLTARAPIVSPRTHRQITRLYNKKPVKEDLGFLGIPEDPFPQQKKEPQQNREDSFVVMNRQKPIVRYTEAVFTLKDGHTQHPLVKLQDFLTQFDIPYKAFQEEHRYT